MGEMGQTYSDKLGVLMIGDEHDSLRLGLSAKISVFKDEEALLTEFVRWVRIIDPGIFFLTIYSILLDNFYIF